MRRVSGTLLSGKPQQQKQNAPTEQQPRNKSTQLSRLIAAGLIFQAVLSYNQSRLVQI